jgi:hypothetical protein
MDQAASANQSVLWDKRQRSEDSDLDRRVELCRGGDRPQASWPGAESLPNPTDFRITLLEKMPVSRVLEAFGSHFDLLDNSNRLILFDIYPDSSG